MFYCVLLLFTQWVVFPLFCCCRLELLFALELVCASVWNNLSYFWCLACSVEELCGKMPLTWWLASQTWEEALRNGDPSKQIHTCNYNVNMWPWLWKKLHRFLLLESSSPSNWQRLGRGEKRKGFKKNKPQGFRCFSRCKPEVLSFQPQ